MSSTFQGTFEQPRKYRQVLISHVLGIRPLLFLSVESLLCVHHTGGLLKLHPPGLGHISGKEPACQCRGQGLSPGQEDPLEKSMATHSSILVWRIPRTEEPGRLQLVGLQRVRCD